MRGLVWLVLSVVVLAGLLFWLAGRSGERPLTTIEKPVPLNATR